MTAARPNTHDPRIEHAIQEFQARWALGNAPEKKQFADQFAGIEAIVLRELIWVEYLCRWKFDNQREPVEVHLNRNVSYWPDHDVVLKLIDIELQYGGNPDRARLVERFPSLADAIAEILDGYAAAAGHPTVTDAPLCRDADATTAPGDGASLAEDSGNLASGAELCVEDRYRIVRLLSDQGGQKYVYEAKQLNPGRIVALKTPRNPASSRSMLMEGQVIAQLEHQNIPPIMNMTPELKADVQVILAEKFIPGTSWHELLCRQRKQAESVPVEQRPRLLRAQLKENLRYLLDVCDALAYAHGELNVIHRDLKPANVMLNRFNDKVARFTEVYVVDWGLALHVGAAPKRTAALDRSQISGFAGTTCYAAPEMWRGVGLDLTTATDVFLLGGILYELLTGTPPYIDRHNVVIQYKARLAKVPPPEARAPDRPFPRELGTIAMKALSADPKARYADAAEFAQAIEQYLKHADAEEKCREAGERLQQIETGIAVQEVTQKHTSISKFIEVADQFRQAGRSWEESELDAVPGSAEYQQALEGERRARLALIDLAEEAGDFALAETQLDQVAALPAPANSGIDERRGRIRAKSAQRRRATALLRGTIAVAIVLLLGLVGTGAGLINANKLAEAESKGRQEAEKRETAEGLARKEAEKREMAEGVARKEAEGREKAEKKGREQAQRGEKLANALADTKSKLAKAQPWLSKAAVLSDQKFQQGAALSFATALNLHDDRDIRAALQESAQRALIPVAWSSQRLMAASLAYSRDGEFLVWCDNDIGKVRVLDLTTGDQLHTIHLHPVDSGVKFFGSVRKIVMHPTESSWCFTAGLDGTICCLDFKIGTLLARASAGSEQASIMGLAATSGADRKVRLVTVDSIGRLQFWDAGPTKTERMVITLHKTIQAGRGKEVLTSVALHPKENLIAVGVGERRVLLYDSNGALLQDLTEQLKNPPIINDVAFSPDGASLAAAGQDGLIQVWDTSSRKHLFSMEGHQAVPTPFAKGPRNWVMRLMFAPSGRLYSTGDDGTIREWDVQAGKEIIVREVKRHDDTLYHAKFTSPIAVRPDGKELASSGYDGRIRLWNADSGALKAQTEGMRPGTMFSVTAAAHCPAKDLLITCGSSLDGLVRSWDTKELRETRVYRGGFEGKWADVTEWPTAAAIDPDGSRFVVGLERGDLLFFNINDDKPVFTVRKAHSISDQAAKMMEGNRFTPKVFLMDWSRDGKMVVSVGAFDQKIKTWDPATGKLVKEWSGADPDHQLTPTEKLIGFSSELTTALVFDPDNKHVVSATKDGVMLRWNTDTGKLTHRWIASAGAIFRIAFSKEGRWAVSGGAEQVALWDWTMKKIVRNTILPALVPGALFKDGKSLQQGFQKQAAGTVFGLTLMPDLGHLAVTQHDGSLSIVDTLSGAVLHRALISPPVEPFGDGAFCFVTKKQEVLTVDSFGVTRWDLAGGPPMQTIEMDAELMGQRITVASDGRQWATSSMFGVTLWDHESDQLPLVKARKREIHPWSLKDWPTVPRQVDGDEKDTPDLPSAVAFAPDNKKLIVGNMFGNAVVWDRQANKVTAVFKAPRPFQRRTATHFTDTTAITALAIDSQSRLAASNTQGKLRSGSPLLVKDEPTKSRVDVWSLADGKLLHTFEWDGERIIGLAFRPKTLELAALDSSGRVTVWNWQTKEKRFTVEGPPTAGSGNVCLAYAPDGSHFVQAGLGGDFQAVDADKGDILQMWNGHLPLPLGEGPFIPRIVDALAFDAAGRLASAGSDGTVRFWVKDAGKYQETTVLSTLRFSSYRAQGPEKSKDDSGLGPRRPGIQVDRGALHYLVLSPDGQYLVTGGLTTKIMILSTKQNADGDSSLTTAVRRLGLRLDGERFVPLERNRLIWFSGTR